MTSVVLALMRAPPARTHAQDAWLTFALRVHVVNREGAEWGRVLDEMDAEVARANRVFEPARVRVGVWGWRPQQIGSSVSITTWEQFDGLRAHARSPDAIDVLAVPGIRIEDVCADGAVPRTPATSGVRIVVVVAHAPFALAHELGHFFGLDHAVDRASLMYPDAPRSADELPSLSEHEISAVRDTAQAMRAAGRPSTFMDHQ